MEKPAGRTKNRVAVDKNETGRTELQEVRGEGGGIGAKKAGVQKVLLDAGK